MSRPSSKKIRCQLFLKCGKVDMLNMKKYDKCKLQLHHSPFYSETKHTIYEESYLLCEDNHIMLHKLANKDIEEYNRYMEVIRHNKKVLELNRFKGVGY